MAQWEAEMFTEGILSDRYHCMKMHHGVQKVFFPKSFLLRCFGLFLGLHARRCYLGNPGHDQGTLHRDYMHRWALLAQIGPVVRVRIWKNRRREDMWVILCWG